MVTIFFNVTQKTPKLDDTLWIDQLQLLFCVLYKAALKCEGTMLRKYKKIKLLQQWCVVLLLSAVPWALSYATALSLPSCLSSRMCKLATLALPNQSTLLHLIYFQYFQRTAVYFTVCLLFSSLFASINLKNKLCVFLQQKMHLISITNICGLFAVSWP